MPDVEELQWFESDEVVGIPTTPGLYAWYAVPVAGPPDWMPHHDLNGHDLGGQHFGSFLAKHTARLRGPTLDIEAKGHLWSLWKGSLTEAGTEVLAAHLQQLADPAATGPGAKLKWALQNSLARELLAAVLVEASPRLSAPIYIGVARNLRERIGTHLETLETARQVLDAGGDLSPEVQGEFGGRAADAGLGIDDLRVAVLPVPALQGLDHADLRRVAEAAEFVLNRWHHPLFGKQ